MQDDVENPLWLTHSGRQRHGRVISATPPGVRGGVSHSGETVFAGAEAVDVLVSSLHFFVRSMTRGARGWSASQSVPDRGEASWRRRDAAWRDDG